MAGGDVSGCVEFSSGYFGFNRFDSGKFGIAFDCTGDTQDGIFGKDPTVDVTAQVLYLDYLELACTTTSARIYDGSGGTILAAALASDVSGVSANTQTWDFRGDPLRCLTAESTSSLCLSSGDGYVSGFMKVWWGRP